MSSRRERSVFNVYENPNSRDVVMAVQLTEDNRKNVRKIVRGRWEDFHLAEGQALTWGSGYGQVAIMGDYVVSDFAGGYQAVEKEVFESAFSLDFSEDLEQNK